MVKSVVSRMKPIENHRTKPTAFSLAVKMIVVTSATKSVPFLLQTVIKKQIINKK